MRRKFCAEGVMHIYQRTIFGFNLFYSLEDFLVFYTIVAVQARKFGVCLWAMCLMIDHIHLLVSAESMRQMSGFISAYTSIYVREFNSWTGRRGSLFDSPYGSAIKLEVKKIRSAIAYLFNNPVEKKLCRAAEDYRWNFLKHYDPAKATSIRHIRNLSRSMQRALKIINEVYNNNGYLNFTLLSNLLKSLGKQEREELADYILSLYFPFRKDLPQTFYKNYENMVLALNANTGSEYEINESHYCKTDVPYREMLQYLKRTGCDNPKDLITAPVDIKKKYFIQLKEKTSATPVQIKKFLHIKPRIMQE
jgi:REP element-mobilizing transposase RayT